MMTPLERAKQFMAFDAMKGLHEALLERERNHVCPAYSPILPLPKKSPSVSENDGNKKCPHNG